jgi:hypothetical protein
MLFKSNKMSGITQKSIKLNMEQVQEKCESINSNILPGNILKFFAFYSFATFLSQIKWLCW